MLSAFSVFSSRNNTTNNTIILNGTKYNKKIKCDDKNLIKKLQKTGKLNPKLNTEDYMLTCENNNYIVGKQLGKGGFNTVYELEDNNDKVIRITNDNVTDDSLEDEISGLFLQYYISNNCKNVCKVHEFGYLKHSDFGKYRVYAILEKLLIPDLITLRVEMPEEERKEYNFRQLIKQSLDGLKCMNANGFVHLDIKLDNIGVGLDKQARLFDFGFSRYIPGEELYTDYSVGTDFYIDPAYRAYGRIHIKSDIYSFGSTLLKIYFDKKYKRNYYDNDIHESQKEEDTKNLLELINKMRILPPQDRISLDEVLKNVWFNPPEKPVFYPSTEKEEKTIFSMFYKKPSNSSRINSKGGKRKYKSKKNKLTRHKKNKTIKTI
jgi:hypothetical protein